ncbi:chaplin [Streptomyces sp. NPDC058045]|uniref:chaplin n=1 Tax=Streptomyces sp. NPDC058045 TaxID=3346311 RepID=UPI0036EEE8A7
MRQVLKRGMLTAAAAGGILALPGAYALADSGAQGTASDSPGVLSGNNVQVPVEVPVNICGNTVDVVGALNPAFGNTCENGATPPPAPPKPHVPEPKQPPAPEPSTPPSTPPSSVPEPQTSTLAETGGNPATLAAGAAAGAALLAAGTILYRRTSRR